MFKRGFFICIIFVLFPSVFASPSLTYQLNQQNVLFDMYSCGQSCTSVQALTSQQITGTTLNYTYPAPGMYLYALYKPCFFPLVNEAPITQDLDGLTVDLEIDQKNICSSSLGSITVEGEKNKTITVLVHSPFSRTDFGRPSFLETLPAERINFFTTLVTLKFYVNNQLYEERNEYFFVNETKTLQFSWNPLTEGRYTLKILTDVPDCKCKTSQQFQRDLVFTFKTAPIVVSPSEQTTNLQTESFNTPTSCTHDGSCTLNCLEGDSDCTCAIQKGYACSEGDTCKAHWLENFGGKLCCSTSCSSESLFNSTSTLLFFGNKSEDGNGWKQ